MSSARARAGVILALEDEWVWPRFVCPNLHGRDLRENKWQMLLHIPIKVENILLSHDPRDFYSLSKPRLWIYPLHKFLGLKELIDIPACFSLTKTFIGDFIPLLLFFFYLNYHQLDSDANSISRLKTPQIFLQSGKWILLELNTSSIPTNIYSVSSIPEKYRRNICRNLLFILAGLILAERNIHSPTAIMLLRKKLPYTCFVGAFILNNKTFYKIYYIINLHVLYI